MNYHTLLPHIREIVIMLVNARFQDSWQVIQTASNIHDAILIPYPFSYDTPMLVFYPPLQNLLHRPLRLSTEMQKYIEQLPPFSLPPPPSINEDILWPARVRFIEAYRQALITRANRMNPTTTTRIEAPFPPMTKEEYVHRVHWLVDRACTISIPQTIDWWADLTCGVATTSPTTTALTHLQTIHPAAEFRSLNGWRQIGYIIELLER